MTGVIATIPRIQFFSPLGLPLAGGRLTTYLAGSTTLVATYQDQDLTIKNDTTITLDATGSCLLWLDPEKSYKFVLKNALGVTQPGWPVDNISGAAPGHLLTGLASDTGTDLIGGTWFGATKAKLSSLGTSIGSSLLGFIQAGTGAVARSIQDELRDRVSVKQFGAKGDGVADDTQALNKCFAYCVTNNRDAFLPDGTYLITRLTDLALSDNKLTVRGSSRERCTIKIAESAYAASIEPALAISGAGDVVFRDVTIDQNRIGLTYPAGHSYADDAKASTWGGGTWAFVIDTTGNVEFENCGWLNVLRGAQVKNAERVLFCRNRADSLASLGQCIVASEDCGSVIYHRNTLIARNWSDNPGITGASGLFGISCESVQISDNFMKGHQLVFHGTTAAEGGYGHRIQVTGNMIDTPPADTAFYRWYEAVVANNIVRQSGDMGIAVSDSSYISVTGNTIAGTHIGGIGLTNCTSGVVSGNVIKDIAQVYPALMQITPRYGSNAGTFLSGIVTDYQAGGGQSKGLSITGNSLYFDTLPPVSDANGPVRVNVNGILFDQTTNTASQNTGVVTGNFLYSDIGALPNFLVMVPTHRFYLAPASRAGTPALYETFSNGTTSFRLMRDYGDGNLVFVDKLVGAVGAVSVFTGATSGAQIVSAGAPQQTFLQCIAANNIDGTVAA